MNEYQVIEHTADVGIHATGATLEKLFTQAALGLLDIIGTWKPGHGSETIAIEVSAHDLGALLVDWLSEILFLQDARDCLISSLEVVTVDRLSAAGSVGIATHGNDVIEGTPVKAITYHQLQVEETEDGWTARVFFDI